MKEFRIRCSSLSSIMADPQAYPRESMSDEELEALKTTSAKRTPEQVQLLDDVMARTLSEGGKTHVHDLVRRHLYDYDAPELTGKEIRKGNAMEGAAINLLSSATGDILSKNDRLFSDGILCGTPDTWDSPRLYDTKVPFTIESWPMVATIAAKMAKTAGYEWQGRGYTMLMNEAGIPIDEFCIAYMLMETPSDLIPPWEDPDIHDIPLHLPPEKRVTLAWFDRDIEIEKRIKTKCKAAHAYAVRLIEMFEREKAQQGKKWQLLTDSSPSARIASYVKLLAMMWQHCHWPTTMAASMRVSSLLNGFARPSGVSEQLHWQPI